MATAAKTLKPLEDRILVRPEEGEETTVLAVGPGKRSETGDLIPMDVSEGDRVIYSKYGGTEIKSGGEDLLILSARDVLAIVV